ncbi:MAG: AMP-binding protein, partial [Mobilitalea sp.]
MNLSLIIEKHINRIPNKLAVISETTNYSWKEFNHQVNKMGNALKKLGVSKGDRVALCLPNSPEYLVSYFAIVKLGAIAVPFNWMFQSPEIMYIVNNSEAKFLICLAGETMDKVLKIRDKTPLLEKIVSVGESNQTDVIVYHQMLEGESEALTPVDCAPDDIVTILYTSGTTGQPKGAMLTH